jgi:tyrosyl-tRNA synthetase
MTEFRSDFLRVLQERGYIHQCSDPQGLEELLKAGSITAYVGYDCTGPSLHIGHLLSIMMLRWFQKTGNRPIALMGGGTTRVGDPSGKDESRRILSLEQIEANKTSIRTAFESSSALTALRARPWSTMRLARAAQLHRFPARRRPALLRQPHAQHGIG